MQSVNQRPSWFVASPYWCLHNLTLACHGPQVLLDNVFKPSGGGPMLQAYISTNNTIFLFVAASAIYGVGSCAVGQLPRLPLVAEAADSQVRDGPSGW